MGSCSVIRKLNFLKFRLFVMVAFVDGLRRHQYCVSFVRVLRTQDKFGNETDILDHVTFFVAVPVQRGEFSYLHRW